MVKPSQEPAKPLHDCSFRFSAPYVRGLLEQIEESERKLTIAEKKIEELCGVIDGLRERCELINA